MVWGLAARQHGVVSRRQLLDAGLSAGAVEHRLARGRLHAVQRGVYALGRPQISVRGGWMAAVLACGPGAALSHRSAGALWGISRDGPVPHVTGLADARHRGGSVGFHRRDLAAWEMTIRDGIPVTATATTLVDLAACLGARELEAAVNAADKLELIDPETLRGSLERIHRRRGVVKLRELLDRRTFRLTDSELERRFLRLIRAAGLPAPQTGRRVSGFRVDFYWPELGLVVETDGLRYHRTPFAQARDRRRDQAHTAAGLTQLRFTHDQVRHEPERVARTLARVIERMRGTQGLRDARSES